MTALEVVEGLGKATLCVGYGNIDLSYYNPVTLNEVWPFHVRSLQANASSYQNHRPNPLRYVYHHLLPEACGGKTIPINLVPLCDLCHYAIHVLLYQLAHNLPLSYPHARNQLKLAQLGIELVIAAGTPLSCIPKEA